MRVIRTLIACVLAGLTLGSSTSGVGAQAAQKVRWDIVSVTGSQPPLTLQEGGSTAALADDGSLIKLTGSGTFVPGSPDSATGGGTWATFHHGSPIAKGTYKVTGLVSATGASGTLPAAIITDKIGNNSDARSGTAVLQVTYDDGDRGMFIVSCHLPAGSPDSIFEGVIASKGFTTFLTVVAVVPGVDANRTAFHVLS